MQSYAKSVKEYLENVPEERREAFTRLYHTVADNLPAGFQEGMGYGMIGWVVPHSTYPEGYHVNPKLPLPFVSIASQKNHVAVYHSGIYTDPKLLDWFIEKFRKASSRKLDMGKSCIRFRNADYIPLELIGELMRKITPQQWIETYKKSLRLTKKLS